MDVGSMSNFLHRSIKVVTLLLLSFSVYYLINIGNRYVEKDKQIIIRRDFIISGILIIIFLAITVYLFQEYRILKDTFFTVILSIILAYLFNPAIKFFEKKGIPRFWGVLLLYLIIVGFFIIFAFLIVPKASKEIKNFISYAPSYFNRINSFVENIMDEYSTSLGEIPFIFDNLGETIKNGVSTLEKVIIDGIKSFFSSMSSFFSRIVSLVLTPILTLYLIVDQEYFLNRVQGLIPEDKLNDSKELFREIDLSLSEFIRGRLFMAAYVGITVTIALLILRVDFAIAIGFITGIADIIPYIGPFLGFVPAVFFAFLQSPKKAIWVAIIFLIIQWTENNVLAPKVIGESTGLHPITVLLSIIIGGGMFGVVGMILSVPVVSVTTILYNFFKDKLKAPN